MTDKEWKKKLNNERKMWIQKTADLRIKMDELQTQNEAAINQIRMATDAILAAVINKYGTDGTIIIPIPKVGVKTETIRTEKGYVIKVLKEEV